MAFKRVALFILLGLVSLAFFMILYLGLYRDPTLIPSPFIGKPMPHFQLTSLDKPELKVDEATIKGKVTLFHVWATWCSTCLKEHDFLMKKKLLSSIPMIGLVYKDDAKRVRHWLQIYGDPYDCVLMDPLGRVALDLGVYGTPESFLVDKEGIIRYKHVGPLNAAVWQNEIETLVKELP